MAIITNKNKTGKKPTMTANSISSAMEAQISEICESGKNNDTISKRIIEEEEASLSEETKIIRKAKIDKAKRKAKNADTINLVLPKGERSNFKEFCTSQNISMTEYAYTCMDYVRNQVQEGLMTVSRSGIRRIKPE